MIAINVHYITKILLMIELLILFHNNNFSNSRFKFQNIRTKIIPLK